MTDKTTGLMLFALGVLLFATQHIAEAVIKSGELSTRSARYDEFRTDNLVVLIAAVVLAVAGLICLFRARK